jgi:hypothetical protein
MRPRKKPWRRALLVALLAPAVQAQTATPWSEDFESYAPGTQIATMQLNGWQHWDLAALGGESVSTNQALSGTRSYFTGMNADSVQVFNETSGQWVIKSHVYVPTVAGPDQLTKDAWWIVLNTYSPGGPKNWSVQVSFQPALNVARFEGGPNGGLTTPLVKDQWAEVRAEIDLAANMAQVYYGPVGNAVPFGLPFNWSAGIGTPGGLVAIQCLDLWANDQQTAANPNGGVYWDDCSLRIANTPTTPFCTAKAGLVCGVPAISVSGVSSATAASGFLVQAGPARNNRSGILMYNTNLGPAVPFQGGTLCIDAMGLRRAGSTNSGGGCGANNCNGVFSIDMNAFAMAAWVVPDCTGAPAGIAPNNPAAFLGTAGTMVHAQYWGRDSVATGSFVSDGVSWVIGP